MRNDYRHLDNLTLQISILDKNNEITKTTTITVEDYMDKTIGKKCQNVADDMISNMIKEIVSQKK
jgi:hypothetical protein